jgi:tRNA threonylcarbamoyladenosine biosynthesis protein TsaE
MAPVSKSSRLPDLEQRFHSSSPERTFALGAGLGKVIEQGDFVGLMGELGAGKTQFVRGVAAGAAVPSAQVASPSFAIVYPYQGRITVHHADLFRVADYDELYATGFTELASGEGAMLVEWLERVPRPRRRICCCCILSSAKAIKTGRSPPEPSASAHGFCCADGLSPGARRRSCAHLE